MLKTKSVMYEQAASAYKKASATSNHSVISNHKQNANLPEDRVSLGKGIPQKLLFQGDNVQSYNVQSDNNSTPVPVKFGNFLENYTKQAVKNIKNIDIAVDTQDTQPNLINAVGSIYSAEETLDAIVATRNKLVQAWQGILDMTI